MAAMRRAASKSKDWDSMAGSIAPATEPAPVAGVSAAGGAAETPARKSAVFSLLRQQAAPKFKEQQAAQGVAQVAAVQHGLDAPHVQVAAQQLAQRAVVEQAVRAAARPARQGSATPVRPRN